MDKTIEARTRLEQLIAGSPTSLDDLLRLRAQLGELENPPVEVWKFPAKKPNTGPLSRIYQPTIPRK
jgi:hypothetical protein